MYNHRMSGEPLTSLTPSTTETPNPRLPWLAAFAAVLVVGTWLWNTPPGLLGKADAVGYAICHRISLRSFHLGDRSLPLCARCTGIYAGLVLGVVTMALAGRSRAGALPPTRVIVVLIGFIALMGIDGVNSYVRLFPGLPTLYEPQNWLRLVTGTLNGLAVAGLVYPVFNQTVWKNWENKPVIGSFREVAGLLGLGALLVAIVLTENPLVMYPLALISAGGVVALLTALDTTLLLIAGRRESRALTWREAALPLLIGFTLAILQIGLIDVVRFSVFRSWDGFVFPG